MNYIATREQAVLRATQIIGEFRGIYGVPQSMLDDLAACSDVLEGRKDPRDRRGSGFGRRNKVGGRRGYDR